MNRVRTAVIPAAGFGTRMLPATKAVPKEMLPVLDKPVIQYVIEEAVASGMERIVIVISDGKQPLRDHLADSPAIEAFLHEHGKQDMIDRVHDLARGASIEYVIQAEQKGLGHAVAVARDAVAGEPFAVLLGDTIIEPDEGEPAGTAQLCEVFARHQSSVVAVRRVPHEWVTRYGIVDGEAEDGNQQLYRLRRLVEKPAVDEAPTNLAIAGRYVFTPDIFDELAHAKPGKGGEIQLTDAMNALAARQPMHALLWRATRFDIGNKLDYVKCFAELAIRDQAIGDEVLPWLRQLINDHTRDM